MFIFLATVLKFGNLLSWGLGGLATDEEFQINIFKIVQKIRQKNTGTWDVNTTLYYWAYL